MSHDYRKTLDKASWSSIHWTVFLSTALGFFAWGFIYSLSVLVTTWPIVSEEEVPLLLTLSPVFFLVGNFIFGSLADRIGRRPIFILTLSIYTVGVVGIILSQNFYSLLFFVAMAQFGVGGEEPPALASLAEFTPIKHRGKAIVLSSNFYNIGAAAAAGLILIGFSSIDFQRTLLGLASVILIGTIIFTRRKLPESIRWLAKKGRLKEAENLLNMMKEEDADDVQTTKEIVSLRLKYSLRFAFVVLVLLGISQLTTYGLLAFVIGPYYYSSIAPQITLVANAGASLAGLVGAYVIEKMSRKIFSLFSYLGGFLTVVLVLLAVDLMASSIVVFFIFLFLNMIFSELGWATRVVLEPELAKETNMRSTFVSLVRVVAWSFYIASIYLTSSLAPSNFVALNVVLWGVGALATFGWFFKGVETGRKSLEAITGESHS
jgi:pentatricopeptide repeat protein